MSLKTLLKVATFNVRGLCSDVKKKCLSSDLLQYNVDLCCLQETKIISSRNNTLNYGKYHLVFLENANKYHGLGFAVNDNLWNLRKCVYKISDRIAVIEFSLPKGILSIINVYGPTQVLCNSNSNIRDEFYSDLSKAKQLTNSSVFQIVMGDLNSKVGKYQAGIPENCMGRYRRGRRNPNGQELIDFCVERNLFIVNTAFQHRQTHITTWTGQRRDSNGNIVNIFNQLDYIMCRRSQRRAFTDARSYAGTLTHSDHRLVIGTVKSEDIRHPFKPRCTRRAPRLNIQLLSSSATAKQDYQNKIDSKLEEATDPDTNVWWKNVSNILKICAEETVGTIKCEKPVKVLSPELKSLSEQQRNLRNQISTTKNLDKRRELKSERNRIQHEIHKKATKEYESKLTKQATEIEAQKDNARMFKAVQLMNRKPYENPTVLDSDGKIVLNELDSAKIIKDHFESQFCNSEHVDLQPFEGNPRPLSNPIKTAEIIACINKLNNNRAAGPDNVNGELLKYGSEKLADSLKDIINATFERHSDLDLGTGTLVPIPKPNKPRAVQNLRPIVLLSTLRKALSLIVLHRISNKIDEFLSHGHSGFRKGRSTSDAVWSHKFLIAHTQRMEHEFTLLGIDMSRAFDTVNRQKLLSTLDNIVDEDELRIIRFLLSNTKLIIKSKSNIDVHFQSNQGVPQGDSLSPVLFTVYLEAALKDLRSKLSTLKANNRTLENHHNIPDEVIYADDTDFVCESAQLAEIIEDIAPQHLAAWNLQMNPDKTEITVINRNQQDSWKNTKKLGTLLGDTEDIAKRKQLAWIAFGKMYKVWKREQISFATKLRLYNAYIKPILLYNAGTWAISKLDEQNLDRFHRKQLKALANIRYPDKISNIKLYRKCNIPRTLTCEIAEARWRLFGHILRLHEETPAQKSMTYYFDQCHNNTSFWGRPKLTLPYRINMDLKEITPLDSFPPQLTNLNELCQFRASAQNRANWQTMIRRVCNAYPLVR